MSMAASIESRVPFLDDRVVAHVVALPGRTKVRWWQTKAILRDAIGDLVPRAILERPKMGFPVPLGRWLAGEFAHVLDDFVLGPRAAARGLFDRAVLRGIADEHRSGAANHADQLWLLINLEIWNRLFCDGEPIEAIARAMRREAPATVGVLAPERVRPPAEPALATTEVKVN
jgi:asparagine synthase (glutamine-hydrolysing)